MLDQINSTSAGLVHDFLRQGILLQEVDRHMDRYLQLLEQARRDLAKLFTSDELIFMLNVLLSTDMSVYFRNGILYDVEDFIKYDGESLQPPLTLESVFSQTLLEKIRSLDLLQEMALVDAIEISRKPIMNEEGRNHFDPEFFFRPRVEIHKFMKMGRKQTNP